MKKFNVLIINNSFEEADRLGQMLGLDDFDVAFVQSGSSVLTSLKKKRVDLVFIDGGLDQTDGFAACRAIKSDPIFEAIPVIFILDSKNAKIIDDVFICGCSDYILKPLNEKELLKKAMFHIELEYSRQLSKDINHILEEKIAERTVELEELLLKLKKANKELESLDIAKSEFLNMISHEIRTPLNGIMGSLALIGRYHFTDEVKSYFSLLDTSVKRLEAFSNTILEASDLRLKGEKILKYSTFNPVIVLQEAIGLCSDKYSAKGIEIAFRGRSDKLHIHADIKFIRKCLLAIIDNAFKFSPLGGKINIAFEEADRFLNITISDQGSGFSEDSIGNIYAPLSNIHSHYDKNTGMGLHLAKLIVEAHSGMISARNIEPHGAEIKIEFPLLKKKHSNPPRQRSMQ
jgi:two-component system, sensor histidine kinase and response regulator